MENHTEAATDRNIRELYQYQEKDINALFDIMAKNPPDYRLLYQLPTGGGKTVIFSEIARRFIDKYNKKVIVLTHRIELCKQTSSALKASGIKNKIINSAVKRLNRKEQYGCYVAMIETLKNRIENGQVNANEFGLVIIDEAHHNSFYKLLSEFTNATIIGVTATPLSSDS